MFSDQLHETAICEPGFGVSTPKNHLFIEVFFILMGEMGLEKLRKTMAEKGKKIKNILKTLRIFRKPIKMGHMFHLDNLDDFITFIFSRDFTLSGIKFSKP